MFDDPETLHPLMNNLLHHAIITGQCDRVLKYMGHPVKKDGQCIPCQIQNF